MLALLWVSPLSRADRETPLPRLGMHRVHRGGDSEIGINIRCITRYRGQGLKQHVFTAYKGEEILVVSIVATG